MIEIDCQKTLYSKDTKFSLDAKLQINSGEFVAFYGKSGEGKTTLLRLIAGFLKPDSGHIIVDGEVFCDKNRFLTPQQRNIGYLFQDYALFPNMNVLKNLLFANKDEALADRLLDLVGLGEHKTSNVTSLSGGQKQRVALARSLMRRPRILLLDEPLSALDEFMRSKLQEYLLKLSAEFEMTCILVSHDVSEIYKLAKTVYTLEDGQISRYGSPHDIFLKTNGSQKFSFLAKILDIKKNDSIYVAIISVGNQICEVVLSQSEAENFQVGEEIIASAKAYTIDIRKAKR